jgi:signal peptidase I
LVILLTLLAGCNGGWSSGDRVLVGKFLYDSGVDRPRRFDVVVFRCPADPQHGGPLDNFIKRLLGLADETLAIFFGHIFVTTDWQPPAEPQGEQASPDTDEEAPGWRKEPYLAQMYKNDAGAKDLFHFGQYTPRAGGAPRKGKFEIVRKDPEVMLALRRIVYDNDYPAKDLEDAHFPARWDARQPGTWGAIPDHGFRCDGKGPDVSWLGYRHILRPLDWPTERDPVALATILARPHRPRLITDFIGYNSYVSARHPGTENGCNWVGDLMLDFELEVDGAAGEVRLELARGVDRFQARWKLPEGRCTLWRLQDGKDPEELKSADTRLTGAGTYRVRFANFDERLTVWVDRDLPFGKGVPYSRAWYYDRARNRFVNTGPTANDLKPAAVGCKGAAVKVRHLQLWRNTYYTTGNNSTTCDTQQLPPPTIPERLNNPGTPEEGRERAALVADHWERFWSSPDQWDPLRRLDFSTMYVSKGFYLCMGDNSPESHDSRAWGLVPERLMLGRALVVYYPFSRAGLIK